jgi:hypothetical protein
MTLNWPLLGRIMMCISIAAERGGAAAAAAAAHTPRLIEIKLIRLCQQQQQQRKSVLSARQQPQFLINCEKLLHAGATRGVSSAAIRHGLMADLMTLCGRPNFFRIKSQTVHQIKQNIS